MNPSRRIRIGLLHRFDARDVRSWSGLLYFMGKSLEKHVGEVVYLGPDDSRRTKLLFHTIWRTNRLAKPILHTRLIGEANRITSKRLAGFFKRRMRDENVDVLFAPVASTEMAYLKTDIPIVYLSDITWKNIIGYYSEYSSLSALGRHEGEHIEMRAIQRANAVVYPSRWAAKTAEEHYRASADKIFRIPFGANLQETPPRRAALYHPLGPTLELLWVGVDWHRKGAATAVECLDELLKSGMDARLTVCGCAPPPGFAHPKVRVFKFLDKQDPKQRKTLSELFLESHFFIFPTRAEAYGVVVAEASAHGLPCLATDTGGVPGVLHEGKNGWLMPLGANGKAYAEKIKAILETPNEYLRLVCGSRDLFEEQLNWDAWGNSMHEVFRRVLPDGLRAR